jgi:hypothetical protein
VPFITSTAQVLRRSPSGTTTTTRIIPLELLGAAGTAADDLWFVGTRGWDPGQCAVVVRKTAAGYERIIDGVPSPAW